MKIRNGFVSNSSSSSFCIYGFEAITRYQDNAIDSLKKMKQEDPEFFIPHIQSLMNKMQSKIAKGSSYLNTTLEIYEILLRIDDENLPAGDIEKLKDFIDEPEYFYELLGLSYHNMDGYAYAGRDWSSVKDEETGLEFKKSVERIAKYITTKKCTTIEEAWYNG
jgi:hypothetical protein